MSLAGGESRAGADAAFSDYVLTRGTALLRMAVMLTANKADAEDLVQAALAKTYLAWDKINDRAALDAYVRRAMVNTHISWWRRRRLEEFPSAELPDRVLPDPAREADMTEPEIAAALGVSLGTVKSTVSRAVARLRGDVELGEDPGPVTPDATNYDLSVFVGAMGEN